jgi:hypothetical protein
LRQTRCSDNAGLACAHCAELSNVREDITKDQRVSPKYCEARIREDDLGTDDRGNKSLIASIMIMRAESIAFSSTANLKGNHELLAICIGSFPSGGRNCSRAEAIRTADLSHSNRTTGNATHQSDAGGITSARFR